VVRLDLNERVIELARMLGGLSDSDSAKAHAQELLHRAVSEFTSE
jgi:DNA repair ATPase RecN